jgi:MFS family permease
VLIDVKPLLKYRDFRFLFVGQGVSFLGSMISYAVVPTQVYELTKSSWTVALVSVVQLIPVLVFGLIGGAVADTRDRRRLLLVAELAMAAGMGVLVLNASSAKPSVALIFVVAALLQALNAFHRPAMDALTQKLVEPGDYAAVAALGSLRYTAGAIVGPAAGGLIMGWGGTPLAYAIDLATFLVAALMVFLMRPVARAAPTGSDAQAKPRESPWRLIAEGLRYARGRPELVGTYVVDVVAMTFAFPTALFPELAQPWGGPKAAGVLFSAMSVGGLVMTVFSGWTKTVRRRGAAVVIAAAIWGLAIIGLGFAPSLEVAAVWLAVAGAADMVSGLFRGVIWNETISNDLRGRLAGVEMISYMCGPLLGNARAGWVSSISSPAVSLVSGGILCVAGMVACAASLRRFWRYEGGQP